MCLQSCGHRSEQLSQAAYCGARGRSSPGPKPSYCCCLLTWSGCSIGQPVWLLLPKLRLHSDNYAMQQVQVRAISMECKQHILGSCWQYLQLRRKSFRHLLLASVILKKHQSKTIFFFDKFPFVSVQIWTFTKRFWQKS